eukprot:m.45433 g.45433  ORF g.45433 m.45433 type:complete len:353 (+) comp10244_c0_seq1:1708-2766(+)
MRTAHVVLLIIVTDDHSLAHCTLLPLSENKMAKKRNVREVVADNEPQQPVTQRKKTSQQSESTEDSVPELQPIGKPKGNVRTSARWTNRQRTLIFSSRGVSYRARHLMQDLRVLLPHSKKDVKLDRKDSLSETVPEICEMKNCNNCVYFEMRKKQDLYLWLGKMPHGPSIKFLVQNVHTMDELRMTGNSLKGSRPILNFESVFNELPHLRLIKELLFQAFSTPKAHPKSKPFVDRAMSFFWLDGRVWIRNFQIVYNDSKSNEPHDLAEIGPRFVLQPIRVFEGAFGGRTLFENEEYVSPNEYRRMLKAKAAQKYLTRSLEKKATQLKKENIEIQEDEVEQVFHTGDSAKAET